MVTLELLVLLEVLLELGGLSFLGLFESTLCLGRSIRWTIVWQ